METNLFIKAVTEFYNSEKNLFLAIIIIGISSIAVGFAFWYFSHNYKAFGITLMILGLLETGIFGYNLNIQQKKIEDKVQVIKADDGSFVDAENAHTVRMTKSYFAIKLFYSSLILASVVVINYSNKQMLNAVLMALIIHLALAITIDNVADNYTRRYKAALHLLEN